MRRSVATRTACAMVLAMLPGTRVQGPPGEPLSQDGVARAAARVDSVFVSRTASRVLIRGGDFGSFLMALMGVVPIPADLRLRVAVNREHIVLGGRLGDLPVRARQALGPMFAMVSLETPVAGEIAVDRIARDAVRFRLAAARVNGIPVPETLLQAVMSRVAQQYHTPTETGRDLVIRIPPEGSLELVTGWVRLSRTEVGNGGPR